MRWTRKRTYADVGAKSLETATGNLLTSVDRQLRGILEAAEARAGEITRAADERATELAVKLLDEASLMTSEAEELLLEANRMTSEAEELARKRGRGLRGVLERRTRMQDAMEALRGLYVAQQAEIERLGGIRSKAEVARDVPVAGQAWPPAEEERRRESEPERPAAPTPPDPKREPVAATTSPTWDEIFPKPKGRSPKRRRRLRRKTAWRKAV